MRRSTILMLSAAILAVVAVPSQAKPAFVAKAKSLGIKGVENCASCHVGAPKKGGAMTPMGKYLENRKAKEKAADVDVAWLKDYKG